MEWAIVLAFTVGFLYKLSKLKSIHVEFGVDGDDKPQEPREVKPASRTKRLKN